MKDSTAVIPAQAGTQGEALDPGLRRDDRRPANQRDPMRLR